MYDENSNASAAIAAHLTAAAAAASTTNGGGGSNTGGGANSAASTATAASNNAAVAAAAATAAAVAAAQQQQQQQQQQSQQQQQQQQPSAAAVAAQAAAVNSNHIVSQLMNTKDSRWLQLEVCREFTRGQCSRTAEECKFAHPPAHVDIQNGRVTACYDSIKGRCTRENPKCKYLHPPQHLKDQLVINGRNNLAYKSLLCSHLQTNGPAALQPTIPVNSLAQLVQQQQHPALVQAALPYQYYPLIYPQLLQTGAADAYSVQTTNGPVPMKRPAPTDKSVTNAAAAAAAAAAAGLPPAIYAQQAAAAAGATQFNPYLLPSYLPAVSCQYFL